jgi:hypothetical protein
MADWKRNFPGRTIPFVGGVMTDATANDLPCYDLENFVPPHGMNNGLSPRDGIAPYVDLSGETSETSGAVILEITNDDPARTRTIAVMQADGKEIIRLGTYTDMEGRKGLNPYSGGDLNDPNNDGEDLPYTPPVPPPIAVENATKFVLRYMEVPENSTFDVFFECDGEGGTVWYEIFWVGVNFGYTTTYDFVRTDSATYFVVNGAGNHLTVVAPALNPSYDQEWIYVNLLIKGTSQLQLVDPTQCQIKIMPEV